MFSSVATINPMEETMENNVFDSRLKLEGSEAVWVTVSGDVEISMPGEGEIVVSRNGREWKGFASVDDPEAVRLLIGFKDIMGEKRDGDLAANPFIENFAEQAVEQGSVALRKELLSREKVLKRFSNDALIDLLAEESDPGIGESLADELIGRGENLLSIAPLIRDPALFQRFKEKAKKECFGGYFS